MPVIAPLEFDDLVFPGERARQSDCTHRGFGAGVDHADHFNGRHDGGDEFCHFNFTFGGRSKTCSAVGRFFYGAQNLRMGMSEDHRSPGTDVVDVFVSVHVPQPGTACLFDKNRRSADRRKCPDGGIDPAGNESQRFFEQLCGFRCLHFFSITQ